MIATRVPYEYYAKYLLSRGSVSAAAHKLELTGFGEQDAGYLGRLKRGLELARPVPCISGSQPHELWLRKHKIYQLSAGKPGALAALDLLQTPRYRSALEIMLTGGVTAEEATEKLLLLSGINHSRESVDLFQHYFWNRDLMAGRDAWREFLTKTEKYTTPNGETGYRMTDRYPQGRTLLTVYESDPEVALWRVGVTSDIAEDVILKTVVNDTFMRWQELRHEPNSPMLTTKLERIGALLLRAVQEQRDSGAQMATINNLQHQLALKVRSFSREDGRKLLSDDRDPEDLLNEGTKNAKILMLPVGRG